MKNNTKYQSRLQALKSKGVKFVVCENTLKNRKISKDAFPEILVEYTPAGIAEIVEKQEQGWSYIKGGY
jgi:intracellular sulfur oxidation DsrE/DsrF family protein